MGGVRVRKEFGFGRGFRFDRGSRFPQVAITCAGCGVDFDFGLFNKEVE